MLMYDLRMTALQLWQMLEDVVHLHIVAQPREQLNCALGPVATIVANFELCFMLEFLFLRQSKKLLANRELTIDFRLRKTKVCDLVSTSASMTADMTFRHTDIEEAYVVHSIFELCGELLLPIWRIELR